MNNWLGENATLIYMILGTLLAVLVGVWWRTRRGWFAIGGGLTLLLIGVVVLLRFLYPSDAELITRMMRDMAAAVKSRDMDRLFAPLSNDFRFRGHNKTDFRRLAEAVMTRRDVTEVEVWGFESEGVSRKDRSAKMSFQVKPRGNWGGGAAFYFCRAEFVLDNDGQWRLKTFEVFNPFVDQSKPMDIPGF